MRCSTRSTNFGAAARREGAEKHHLLGVLADVDEAAGARQPGAELADVDAALAVGLRHAEEGHVEPAAVVEVELRRLIDQRLDVAGGAEIEPARRHARRSCRVRWSASGSRAIRSSLATLATPSGMPIPRLTTLLGRSSKAARRAMILRGPISIGGMRAHRYADFTAESGVVGGAEGLPVLLRRGHDDAVHQHAGYPHEAGVQAAGFSDALDLDDDDAAGVAGRRGDRQRLEDQRLPLHGDVAVRVRSGAAQDRDIDRPRLVEQILRAARV